MKLRGIVCSPLADDNVLSQNNDKGSRANEKIPRYRT